MSAIPDVVARDAAERLAAHDATNPRGFERRPPSGAAEGEPAPVADENPLDGLAQRMAAQEQMLPDRFWTQRPALEHIRQAAQSRLVSPDAVLHSALARFASSTPHTYVLPPTIGGIGSLNYFTLLIAMSGIGKSASDSVARDVLGPLGSHVLDRPLGSGEGLAEVFMGYVQVPGEDGKPQKVRQQVAHNVFIYTDEGEALTNMMSRQGATIGETLRSAWTGGRLGQANATSERSRNIPAHAYRLGLVIAFQPEKVAQMLADDVGGTPQRFMFASATDPNAPDATDHIDWPGELEVPAIPSSVLRAHEDRSRGRLHHVMGIDPAITTELRAERVRFLRLEDAPDPLDSHRPLHMLKLSGLLALLDGRFDITADDWKIAEIMWATSRRVRGQVEAAVRAQEERTEAARVARYAAREHAAEAARGSAREDVERLAKRLGRWVHDQQAAGATPDDGHARRDLHHRLKSTERALLDPAITHAISAGWITEDDGRFQAGESMPA